MQTQGNTHRRTLLLLLLLCCAGHPVAARQTSRRLAGASKAMQNCQAAGFALRLKQLPQPGCDEDCSSAVRLYTIRGPETAGTSGQESATFNLAATVARCKADPACVKFTSDGFLIGAYRSPADAKSLNAAIARERQQQGPLQWMPMQYCSGACCGTWVAEGLEQQMLTPLDSSFRKGYAEDLPTDFKADVYLFDAANMKQFCARPEQKQDLSQFCAPSCQAACCALFAKDGARFALPSSPFMQCHGDSCGGCAVSGDFGREIIERQKSLPAAHASASVLTRQYLRAVSAQSRPATGSAAASPSSG